MQIPSRNGASYRYSEQGRLEKSREKLVDESIFTVFFNDKAVFETTALRRDGAQLASGFLACFADPAAVSDSTVDVDVETGIISIKSCACVRLKRSAAWSFGDFADCAAPKKAPPLALPKADLPQNEDGLLYASIISPLGTVSVPDLRGTSAFLKAVGFALEKKIDPAVAVAFVSRPVSVELLRLVRFAGIRGLVFRGAAPSSLVASLALKTGIGLALKGRRGVYTFYGDHSVFDSSGNTR